jgi:hypothetical protein
LILPHPITAVRPSIGLAIVAHLAASSGGTVSLQRRPGGGLDASATLPRAGLILPSTATDGCFPDDSVMNTYRLELEHGSGRRLG